MDCDHFPESIELESRNTREAQLAELRELGFTPAYLAAGVTHVVAGRCQTCRAMVWCGDLGYNNNALNDARMHRAWHERLDP